MKSHLLKLIDQTEGAMDVLDDLRGEGYVMPQTVAEVFERIEAGLGTMRADLGKICGLCGRRLNVQGDPTTEDCGGDCLRCMAVAGDPSAKTKMATIRASADAYPPPHLTEDEDRPAGRLMNIIGCMETALEEAEGMPQEGGAEATIQEQLEAAIAEAKVLMQILDPVEASCANS